MVRHTCDAAPCVIHVVDGSPVATDGVHRGTQLTLTVRYRQGHTSKLGVLHDTIRHSQPMRAHQTISLSAPPAVICVREGISVRTESAKSAPSTPGGRDLSRPD